jgi:hypothetical protein
MDDPKIERIRNCRAQILIELYGAHPLRVSVEALHRRLKRAQFDFSPDEIERQALVLCGQGLASDSIDAVSGTPRYAITSAGMLTYENSR